MPSPIRRRPGTPVVLAALALGALVTAGCGGTDTGGASRGGELFFQPAAARGTDPFTASAAADSVPAATGARPAAAASTGRARTLPGTTPGVYGVTRGRSSCDVERQIRLLTESEPRSRAFAAAAGIGDRSLPTFLRELTPVVLRADTRVTDHGYRSGSATSFQSVLQAGTAVLVDDRGMPRVRCAGGNPLAPAVVLRGVVGHRGETWAGYGARRVVVIVAAPAPVGGLVLVDTAAGAWVERTTGTDGDQDHAPGVQPPYDPGADLFDPQEVTPPDGSVPGSSRSPEPSAPPSAPDVPLVPAETPPSDEPTAGPDAPLPVDEPAAAATADAPRSDGSGGTDGDPFPTVPDAPGTDEVLMGPDAGRG